MNILQVLVIDILLGLVESNVQYNFDDDKIYKKVIKDPKSYLNTRGLIRRENHAGLLIKVSQAYSSVKTSKCVEYMNIYGCGALNIYAQGYKKYGDYNKIYCLDSQNCLAVQAPGNCKYD